MLDSALRGQALWAKMVRFGIVGGISTCLYGAFTWLLVAFVALPPLFATSLGYLLVIPFNFALQKVFTFRSEGAPAKEIPKFLLVHGMNLAASMLGMHVVVRILHSDYRLGILLTMITVPIATFVAMNLWVFGKRFPHSGLGLDAPTTKSTRRASANRRKDGA